MLDINHVFDCWNDAVEWQDDETVMWEDGPLAMLSEKNERLTAIRVSRAEKVEWPVTDAVRMELRPLGHKAGRFHLALWACQPNLKRYLVQVDDGEWAVPRIPPREKGNPAWGFGLYPIDLEPGRHTIRTRAQRTTGGLGPISHVTLEFAPAP